VVPFRDEAEGVLFDPMGRTAQTQAHQGVEAQTEAARVVRQDLGMPYRGGVFESRACLRQKRHGPRIAIVKAGKEQTGLAGVLEVCAGITAHRPAIAGIQLGYRRHVGINCSRND